MKLFRTATSRKKWILTLLLVFISLTLWSCLAYHRSSSPYPQAIVTAQGTIVPVEKFGEQLEKMVDEVREQEDADNIILFVHGRGKHPDKAFRQHLLTDLEANYSARVLMFHWPAWEGPLGFPEAQARAAAPDFIRVLTQLHAYQDHQADMLTGIRFTLLTQSMGSLVLEESVRQWQESPLPGHFDTVVISAPASTTTTHTEWIDRLSLSEHNYITTHRHDPVLASAEISTGQARLGKSIPTKDQPLSPQVIYLDISNAWVMHRYYLHRYLKLTPPLQRFFDQTLNGLPATLDAQNGFTPTDRTQVFQLSSG